MQVRALVALMALAMAITLGVSLTPDDPAPSAQVAASAPETATTTTADGPDPSASTARETSTTEAHPTTRAGKRAAGKKSGVDCAKLKCVAITFDDGPGLDTARLLQILERRNAKATFFLVGKMVEARPKVARRLVRAGHELGVHTMGHPDLTKLSDEWVTWQLAQTKKLIAEATGVTPTLSRPPYGATNARVLRLQGALGLSEVLWNVDTTDWKIRNAGHVSSTAVGQAKRNSVVLMHDIRPTTVDAVDAIVRGLRKRGFTLVTVSELIGNPRPGRTYFDWHTTTQTSPKVRKAKAAAGTSAALAPSREANPTAH